MSHRKLFNSVAIYVGEFKRIVVYGREMLLRYGAITLWGAFTLTGCEFVNSVECGPGTRQLGRECVIDDTGSGGSTSSSISSGGGGSTSSGSDTGGSGGSDQQPPSFYGVTSVSPASSTSLVITWISATDSSTEPGDMKYNIYLATELGGQNFESPDATSEGIAEFIQLFDLEEDATYYVVVRAENENGLEEDNTVELFATLQDDDTAPTFAGIEAVSTVSATSVEVSWTAAEDDLTDSLAISYAVYMSDQPDSLDYNTPILLTTKGATSTIVDDLPSPETTYYFGVRAYDAAGNHDDNTVELAGETAADVEEPSFSGCSSAITLTASSVLVSWPEAIDNSSVASEITYHVFASTEPGQQTFEVPAASFTGETSGSVTGLTPETTYYFVCRAEDVSANMDSNTTQVSAKTFADDTSPSFDGLVSIDKATVDGFDLFWSAATDDATATEDIVYDVYISKSSSWQNFEEAPQATSDPGATSYTVTGLELGTTYYVVVRARDLAGNQDSNLVEVSASTLIGYDSIQEIYDQSCALCHSAGGAPYGLELDSAFYSYLYTVNVPSAERPADGVPNPIPLDLIEPYDASKSWLYLKVTGENNNDCPDQSCCLDSGEGNDCGSSMPFPTCGDCVQPTEEQKERLKNWILQGAQDL